MYVRAARESTIWLNECAAEWVGHSKVARRRGSRCHDREQEDRLSAVAICVGARRSAIAPDTCCSLSALGGGERTMFMAVTRPAALTGGGDHRPPRNTDNRRSNKLVTPPTTLVMA